MAESRPNLATYTDAGNDTGMGPGRGPTTGAPRWAKVLGIIALVGAMLVGILLLAGGDHGPGRHTTGDDAGGQTPPRAGGAQPATSGGGHASAGPSLSGLAISLDGFTLEPSRTTFPQEGRKRYEFRIVDDRGRVVRDGYELESNRELHLVVVRRDTAVYEHVHPRRSRDGTWSVDLGLREPGVYRAFADFQIDGKKRALATDLFVPGDFQPKALPDPEPVNDIDEFSVALAAQALRAGQASTLTLSIKRGETPFTELERYLGARGHLVALREGDLGYLHVHPDADGDSNAVAFEATFPTAGRYRLFFQFKTGGRVRTVDYTMEVPR